MHFDTQTEAISRLRPGVVVVSMNDELASS